MTFTAKLKCKIARILGMLLFAVLKLHGVNQIVITDPQNTEILMEFPS
jgi:hypothetical protein